MRTPHYSGHFHLSYLYSLLTLPPSLPLSHTLSVIDQIRTVCQAELLMKKKMKQYLGLVNNVETDGDNTTAEDLQVKYTHSHSHISFHHFHKDKILFFSNVIILDFSRFHSPIPIYP